MPATRLRIFISSVQREFADVRRKFPPVYKVEELTECWNCGRVFLRAQGCSDCDEFQEYKRYWAIRIPGIVHVPVAEPVFYWI